MNVLYVIGLPGSGKSSALARAYEQLSWGFVQVDQPLPHMRHSMPFGSVIELGKHRDGGFSGTDALSMAINPRACAYVEEKAADPALLLIAEGDRLANAKFFGTCRDKAQRFAVVWVDTPLEVAQERMAARAAALGRQPQNHSWWRGRSTKVNNLVTAWQDRLVRIDGCQPLDDVASEVRNRLTMLAP